jgi:hypothetical protein
LPPGVKAHKQGFQARPLLPGLGRVYLGQFCCALEAGRAVQAAMRLVLLAFPGARVRKSWLQAGGPFVAAGAGSGGRVSPAPA